MPRPLRLLFPYGVYHLTSRGVDGRFVFMDDDDRRLFLVLLCRVTTAFEWTMHVYCEMGNHFHLIVECGQPGLSKGMERLNGLYASQFNARHKRVGHLFQRRFEARVVEDDDYLEEAIRYVLDNPVRAGICRRADAWPWSGRSVDLDRYARAAPTTTRRVRSGARPIPVTIS
jgi:putative transposase